MTGQGYAPLSPEPSEGRESLPHQSRHVGELLSGVLTDLLPGQRRASDRVPTGFVDLDAVLGGGLPASSVLVVGGRPGMGRVALSLGWASTVALDNQAVAILSSSISAKDITLRLLSSSARVPICRLRAGAMSRDESRRVREEGLSLNDRPIYLCCPSNLALSDVVEECGKLHREEPLRLVVIACPPAIEGGGEAARFAADAMMVGLRALARQLGCTIVLGCNLSPTVDERADRRPLLGDFPHPSLSAAADVVMLIYRDQVYDPDTNEPGIAEVVVAKPPPGGQTGTARLAFVDKLGLFANLGGT